MIEESARGVLRKVKARHPMFNKGLYESAGFWVNDAMPIGIFNFAEAVDPWNESQVHEYEEAAAEFLDEMNTKLHVPGWHVDLNGMHEGTVILCKDRNEDVSMSSSEGDYGYTHEAAYLNYLDHKAMMQRQLKTMVREALVLTDETKSIDESVEELFAVNEGAGDFINDAWTKFKNFFAKLWQKFNEFIARNLNTDKNYLTKYKQIILNKEVQIPSFDVDANYVLGVKNLSQFSVYTPSASDINNFPNSPDNGGDKIVQQKFMPAFKSAGNVEFADFCKSYFKGGQQKYTFTKDNLNMSDLFNYCYNYDKIVATINKDRTAMENAIRSFQQAAQDLDKNVTPPSPGNPVPAAGGGASAGTPPNPQSGNGNPAQSGNPQQGQGNGTPKPAVDDAAKKAQQAKIDSAQQAFDTAKKAYDNAKAANPKDPSLQAKLNAANAAEKALADAKSAAMKESALFGSISEALKVNKAGATPSGTTATTVNANNNNFGNVSKNGTTLRDKAGDDASKLANNNQEVLRAKLTMYTSTCSTIFASMLTAAETIDKDYMGIIKAHVQSYLGNTNADNVNANAMTNNGQNINFADDAIANMEQQIATINSTQDTNQKTTLTNNLLNYAASASGKDQQGNPVRTFKTVDELQQVIDAIKAQKQAQQSQQQQGQQGQQTQAQS